MIRDYRTPRHAIVVTADGFYYGSGRIGKARPDQAELLTDLPRLLAGAKQALTAQEGVLIIAGPTLTDMTQPDPGAGWIFTEARPWTTYVSADETTGRGDIIHVGILSEIDPKRSPLFHPNDNPDAIASMLDRWHVLTGGPWFATGGVTGCGAIRNVHSLPGKGAQPLWRSALPRGVRGRGPMVWHRDVPADAGWLHVFDVNAMYLAALKSTAVAWGALAHTGATPTDPMTAAGFWLVDTTGLPRTLLGHGGRPPVIPPGTVYKGAAWVSAPVMRYLCQRGISPDVLDSWTCENTETVARSYAERLSAARMGMVGDVPAPVREAIKSTYVETVGMVGRQGGRIWRVDWQIAWMDQATINMVRRLDRCADRTGLWPIRVNTDAVYYLTDDPSPDALADALGVGRGPGTFKHVSSSRYDSRAQLVTDRATRVGASGK